MGDSKADSALRLPGSNTGSDSHELCGCAQITYLCLSFFFCKNGDIPHTYEGEMGYFLLRKIPGIQQVLCKDWKALNAQ